MSVNKVILVGRLGRDPETRYTGGGQAVANFSVATDETYKDRNGERQKRTEWHKIVVWGKQAEIAQQYLKKGSLIFIEGRIQSREWQDKEGQKRTSFEIVATNFRMLGGRAEGAARPAVAPTISTIRQLRQKTRTAVAAAVTPQPGQKSPTKTFPSNQTRATTP
jgi:single-strand DNA-binding protein